jgi:hypothetical protein
LQTFDDVSSTFGIAFEILFLILVEQQLIEAATHRSGNSSKRQLTEYPLEVPFTKRKPYSTIHQISGNSSNALI